MDEGLSRDLFGAGAELLERICSLVDRGELMTYSTMGREVLVELRTTAAGWRRVASMPAPQKRMMDARSWQPGRSERVS